MLFSKLCVEERATIQIGHAHGLSQREIALSVGELLIRPSEV
ncbi:helix-turn-helix domain-containing protein [Halothiobacillus sp.]|nr:helix-turn-helix domain-containing protein [Halothiobacillus sp.]